MNDKDKEVYENLWDEEIIKKLQDENANLKERIFMKTTLVDSLKAENSKLRECVEFYSDNNQWEGREIDGNDWRDFYEDGNGIGGRRAAETLKNLELK
jgi:hypothetical protein